jgi:hypothetical protein
MNWLDLKWHDCAPPVGEASIRDVEHELGFQFPDDFRECIKVCHGGTPEPNCFDVVGDSRRFGTCLGALMQFDRGSPDGILESTAEFAINGDCPAGVIPFGDEGAGGFICFYFNPERPNTSPSVIFWHRTGYPKQEFMFLANSFSEFLDLLRHGVPIPTDK